MAADAKMLRVRARIVNAIRAYFDGRDFLEVETPIRVANPGQELHLDAFAAGQGHDGGDRYLITSPEHHMKRMLGAGHTRVFQVTRCFRKEEKGPHHQPEFTMLEWYRAGDTLDAVAADAQALLLVAAAAAGRSPPQDSLHTTVRQLFAQHVGVELVGDEPESQLRSRLETAGHATVPGDGWDDLFFRAFLDRVEPAMDPERPTFVFDWPLPLAALARRKPGNPAVAERFELYAAGLELCNAFGELLDGEEQRRRFTEELQERRRRQKVVYPIDDALIEALPKITAPAAGAALGVDRLVMWATGARDIREVVAFPEG
jgi:elongation factor P--(R)-beta-lysine ligase